MTVDVAYGALMRSPFLLDVISARNYILMQYVSFMTLWLGVNFFYNLPQIVGGPSNNLFEKENKLIKMTHSQPCRLTSGSTQKNIVRAKIHN